MASPVVASVNLSFLGAKGVAGSVSSGLRWCRGRGWGGCGGSMRRLLLLCLTGEKLRQRRKALRGPTALFADSFVRMTRSSASRWL